MAELLGEKNEFPFGVVGIVSGYTFKKAKGGNRNTKQPQKISLEARSCKLLGRMVQATDKMDLDFKI